jgi:hypothetical protein
VQDEFTETFQYDLLPDQGLGQVAPTACALQVRVELPQRRWRLSGAAWGHAQDNPMEHPGMVGFLSRLA